MTETEVLSSVDDSSSAYRNNNPVPHVSQSCTPWVDTRLNGYRPLLPFPYKYPIEKHAGPMLIPPHAVTLCGVCGMCITLEDERDMLPMNYARYNNGQAAVEHIDAGNRELQKLQAKGAGVDGEYAGERKFGVMPKPGWTGLYRVLICRTKLPPKRGMSQYHVSGIGRFHLWDSDPEARKIHGNSAYGELQTGDEYEPVFTVPWKKDELLIDRQHFYNKTIPDDEKDTTTSKSLVKRISVYPAHFHDQNYQQIYPHGFPIHANCWALAERVIGSDLIEKNLKLFLNVLQQRWKDEPMFVDSQEIANWIIDRGSWRSGFYSDYFNQNYRCEYEVNRNLVAIRDPMCVYEVEEIIAESAKKYTLLKEKMGDTVPAPTTIITSSFILYSIPYEVWMVIFDWLHYSEIVKLLSAARLRMPWSYWQQRAPRDIIWELDDIDLQTTPIDWQHLCLRAERLCEESLGLINRQRICNILKEVGQKVTFFSDVVVTDDQAETPNTAVPVSDSVAIETRSATVTRDKSRNEEAPEENLYDAAESEADSGLSEWDDEYDKGDYQATAEWDRVTP
ncbi:hypothetical protein BGW36DRAFT_285693 [Talaromyces proteolyticus]|uniref:F-box domain-containing protein n=1 Tax=Talaromyces proteolyticus TaxID=1131652 RepID=A0AAD4Q712_9EURO|nr:uncharacterized protein BGW36DRAFT_285693 [Talaromyces proteolyticus]KAH8705882.1 hypothetical protein BGW36DRAFT_285693 [Talaromyces proteolyticus]